MTHQLYDYQQHLVDRVFTAWGQGLRRVLVVAPTGAGKTVIFSEIMRRVPERIKLAVAHRQELVVQMSCALARNQIPHKIIGPMKMIRLAQREHVTRFGRVWVDPRVNTAIASVQTLVRRDSDPWLKQVTMWITDEAHHLQSGNQWGRAIEMLCPQAIGLGVTATPYRADGKGLDTVFDHMVVGPSPRELIARGYLTDYVIYSPSVRDLKLESVPVGASGDYVQQKLRKAVRGSQYLVGDVVGEYLKRTPGKLGATFATDVETAGDIANQYRACGVPAEVVTAKTPAEIRGTIMQRFERREILQLVTVDIISEGFDLPALEVASMARPTESKALCHQQFGRILRRMDGKSRAVLIDHVGNMLRHLPPEYSWDTLTLKGSKGKKQEEELTPVKACPGCTRLHERYLKTCPYCGYRPEPVERSSPEQVDGDLKELTQEVFLELLGRRDEVDKDPEVVREEMQAKHAPAIGVLTAVKRHKERREAQRILRELMAWYGGIMRGQGLERGEGQRRFYLTFGIDVLSAQGLKLKETVELEERLRNEIKRMGYAVGDISGSAVGTPADT